MKGRERVLLHLREARAKLDGVITAVEGLDVGCPLKYTEAHTAMLAMGGIVHEIDDDAKVWVLDWDREHKRMTTCRARGDTTGYGITRHLAIALKHLRFTGDNVDAVREGLWASENFDEGGWT